MLGYRSFTTVQKWEDGSSFPKTENLVRLADLFHIDIDHLLNADLSTSKVSVPILGIVKAGYDLFLDSQVLGYEYVDQNEYRDGEYFYLKVQGDSMKELRICDQDEVYVRKQDYLEEGDIGVFLLPDDVVTIKKYHISDHKISLIPANDAYPIVSFAEDEIRILGRVIHCKVYF